MPMPSVIIVEEETEQEYGNDLASYICVGGGVGEIHINVGHPGWSDIAATIQKARQDNEFSTHDPRRVIMHELGELAMHQSVGPDRFDLSTSAYRREERTFRKMSETGELDEIADAVSDRAIENHSEFVAEVFAALMLGRNELRQNALVMEAFLRFGGERIAAWTESSR